MHRGGIGKGEGEEIDRNITNVFNLDGNMRPIIL
jgi:hypothetical protein